jgi:hypothetical protein
VHAVDRPRASSRSRLDHRPARSREPLSTHDLDERSPFCPTCEPTDGIEQRLEPHAPLLRATDDRGKILCEHAEFLRMLATDPPHSGGSVEPAQEPRIRCGIRRRRRRGAQDRGDCFGRERITTMHASDQRLAHEKRAGAIEVDVARIDRRSDARAS